MREFGRVMIDGKTYKKILMDKKVCYKVKIDGVVYYEEHETVNDAMKMAKVYFAQDHSLHAADILKYTVEDVGVSIKNKDFEKTIVDGEAEQ